MNLAKYMPFPRLIKVHNEKYRKKGESELIRKLIFHFLNQDRGHCSLDCRPSLSLRMGNYLTSEEIERRKQEILNYDFSPTKKDLRYAKEHGLLPA